MMASTSTRIFIGSFQGSTLDLQHEIDVRIGSLAFAQFQDNPQPVPHAIIRQAQRIDRVAPVHDDMTELSFNLRSALALGLRKAQRKYLELEQDALQALQQRIVQLPGDTLAFGAPLVFR